MGFGLRAEPGNACERAKELKRRIDEIGHFKFTSGYLSMSGDGQVCLGCALGAAAFAAGCRTRDYSPEAVAAMPERAFTPGYKALIETLKEPKVEGFPEITRQEQMQLEMGYEAWDKMLARAGVCHHDPKNPFHELGALLAERGGYKQAEAYQNVRAGMSFNEARGYSGTP